MEQLKVKYIRDKNINITQDPIVYYWWFKESIFKTLLFKLESEIDFKKIKLKTIKGTNYGLLYIGQAKRGNDRLVKYHMLDYNNFHERGVKNGRLSSLRTTLCGLLDLPMSKSKYSINDFMDENCIVEWEVSERNELNEFEQTQIKQNYLPLNYQHTKGILSFNHRKILRESKKQMRN